MRQSDHDQVTVIGCAITLREAMKAADDLAESGIHIRVIDPFTIKPIDAETIISSARVTGGRIVTVEDHYYQGKQPNHAVWNSFPWHSWLILKIRIHPSSLPVDLCFFHCFIECIKWIIRNHAKTSSEFSFMYLFSDKVSSSSKIISQAIVRSHCDCMYELPSPVIAWDDHQP